MFFTALKTNNNSLPINGFHKRGEVCLLRGTSWIYKFNSEKSQSSKGQRGFPGFITNKFTVCSHASRTEFDSAILYLSFRGSQVYNIQGEAYKVRRLTPLWGISRLTPLYPTNAPGSQYIVVGDKAVRNAWHGCQVRTTSRSWDKGVLTDLCLTLYMQLSRFVAVKWGGIVTWYCGLRFSHIW